MGSLKKTIEGEINEEIIKAEQLVSSLVCCFVVYIFWEKGCKAINSPAAVLTKKERKKH